MNGATWVITMYVDTIRKGMEEFDITDGTGHRRRKTDITPPDITQSLDYETEKLVTEFIESQQQPPSVNQSILLKLFNVN